MVIYKDAADSHWDDNPTAIDIEEIEIDQSSSLTIQLVEGGGFAISFVEAVGDERLTTVDERIGTIYGSVALLRSFFILDYNIRITRAVFMLS